MDIRTQFTFYESFYKAVSRIKKAADRAIAYDAICAYALYGTEPDLDKLPAASAIAFELIKPNLDASRKKAKSGKKGGESKQTESKPKANDKQTATKKEKEKENKKEGEKEKEYECTPLTPLENFSSELKAAVQDWLDYKKERREAYKPTGLANLIGQIRNCAEKYGEAAVIEVIRSSMAANYQGIVFDRLRKGAPNDGKPKGNSGEKKLYGNYV